jgi:hypothetical protein
MVELIFYVWLLGASLLFVTVAVTGEATDRHEAIWLLVLSSLWPIVLVIFLIGALVTMIGILNSAGR